MKRVLESAAAMQQLAAEVAISLKERDILLLTGDLGAGKTTFTQGIAAALGIAEAITSPTFTIVSEYEISPPYQGGVPEALAEGEGVRRLVHVDLYRLEDDAAAQDPAVRDVLDRVSEPGQLTVIEWSEKLGAAAPTPSDGGVFRIAFAHGATENERTLTMTDA